MKYELTAQVGADGVLTLSVPLGRQEANQTVHIVVETVVPGRPGVTPFASREEWLRFVDETKGQWLGEFERPPQSVLEEREPL